ncbi:hypothetical protein [Kribbella sp. NBC_00359]|uniref:hypothetical protein n=1 Tax=Kribbella sp. NBC_00359 TaxID=2975966 RepID=UPI002E1CA554
MEIISWLDDGSCHALHVTAHHRMTGPIVLASFPEPIAQYRIPAFTLTENGMVCTTRLSGGKGGRNGLAADLWKLNVIRKNSRPNHTTTCERWSGSSRR